MTFGKTAERCNQWLSKDSAVQVEGVVGIDPKTGCPRIWEKDGVWRSVMELNAHTVRFLGNFHDKHKQEAKPDQEELIDDPLPY